MRRSVTNMVAGNHDIILPASDGRVHVFDPKKWGELPGTDFWIFCGSTDTPPTGDTDLVSYGWETSGVSTFTYLPGSGADFLSGSPIADAGATGGYNFGTAGDYLISPFIFGDYVHARMVQELLGYFPTELNLEVYGRFAANPDENASGFGFVEAGGGGGVLADADLMAFIGPGGSNFELIRGDGTVDAGAAAYDTDPHLFKIKCSGMTAEWFIDDVSQGTLGLQDDLWPVAFAINTEAGGTADPVVSWVHVYYN